MRHALLVQRVESRLRQVQPGRHGRAAPRLGIRRSDQWTLRSRRWMPKMTSAATGTKNRSKAPWPPPLPVDDTPEFGGAGALGGNGGKGSGPFRSAGRCERPPEAELFTVERTVERATACAELELVSPVAVALVRTSTRRNVPRRTIERDVRTTAFGLGFCAERSRSCWTTGPASMGEPATPASGEGIGSGAARSSIGPVPTAVGGPLIDVDDGVVSWAAGDVV